MPALDSLPDVVTAAVGLPAVVAANLLPLVGVVAYGWTLGTLLALYWLEAAATVLLAAVKALFAERGSTGMPSRIEPLHELRAKRGGWLPREGWPPVYPRNVPIALSILGTWVVAVVPLSALYWLSLDLSVPLSVGFALGVGALAIGHAAEFVVEYVGERRYREVSAAELAATPAVLSVVVAFLGVLSIGAGRSSAFAVLTLVVLGKTAASTYRFSAERFDGVAGRVTALLPDAERSEPPPELELPDDPVAGRAAVDARAVVAGSLGAVGYGFANRVSLGILGVFVLSLLSGNLRASALATLPVAGIVAVRVGGYYLRYGTIEYQRRGDDLVAYDTVLEEPQWIAGVYRADVSVRNAIVDRLLGTGTLTISEADGVDRDVRLGPVSDLDSAVETLELPVHRTDRPDRDPAVVVAGAVLAATFLVVPAVLFLSPAVDDRTAVGILVAFAPFLLLPIGALVWAALSRI